MSGAGLLRPGRFAAALLVAGAVLVAVGAPGARSGAALALLPLDLLVLALAAGVVALAWRAPEPTRRAAAASTVLLLLVAVPCTRIPSAGELIAVLAAAVAALTVLGLRGTRARLPRGSLPGAALLVLLVVGTAAAPDRFGLLRLAPFVLAVVPVFLLVGGADATARRRVLRVVVLLGVAEAVLAALEPLLGAPQLWAPARTTAAGIARTLPNPLLPELVRSQGTLGHPLTLGVLLLVALALVLTGATGLPARVRGAAAVVLVAGLLVTGSRNGLLIAAVLALLALPRRRPGRRTVLAVAIGAGVLVLAGVASAPVLASWAASGSATHRLGALSALPGLLAQPPLPLLAGNGWASTHRMFAADLLQADGLQAVDDQLVLTLSQAGLVGLGLLLAVVGTALRHRGRALLPAALAAVLTLLVFDPLAWPSTAALTALLLAVPRPALQFQGPAVLGCEDGQERRAYSR